MVKESRHGRDKLLGASPWVQDLDNNDFQKDELIPLLPPLRHKG